ncbi:MAG: hypothetical protein ACRYFS_04480 [Janthinobacterium lividum]
MKKPLIFVIAVFVVSGIAVLIVATVPHEAPKVGPPIIAALLPGEPLAVYMPMSNRGTGELQVTIGIWGAPSDISHGTVNGLETHQAGKETQGCGSTIVSSHTTYFLPSYRDQSSVYPGELLGEIGRKRKYPVHLGFGWWRGTSESTVSFVIPPDRDIVVPLPMPGRKRLQQTL